MLKRNKSSEKIDKKVQRAADFELTVADMARRSEKRAWRVAGPDDHADRLPADRCDVLPGHVEQRGDDVLAVRCGQWPGARSGGESGGQFGRVQRSAGNANG